MSKKGPDLSIALIGGPHDGGGEDKGDAGGDDAKEAMSAFLDAVKGGDVDAALAAFGALCDMHAPDYDEDEEPGEGD